MKKDVIQDFLRTKDKKEIYLLLNTMCNTAARDIDVFIQAQQKYREIRDTDDEFLSSRILQTHNLLKTLTLLKANIFLLTQSPL